MYPRSSLGDPLTGDIAEYRGVNWNQNVVPDHIRKQIATRYSVLTTEKPACLLSKCQHWPVEVCDVTLFLCDMLHCSPPPTSPTLDSDRQVLFTTCMPLVHRPQQYDDLQFHALQMMVASHKDLDETKSGKLFKDWAGYDLEAHLR
jgi:hypothetical protein